MNQSKNEYNGSTTHFTRCYSGYQQYGISGPCSCLAILNPTPATVMPDIMRGVKPHNMQREKHVMGECSGCFKNQYATITPRNDECYVTRNSCQCTNIDNI